MWRLSGNTVVLQRVWSTDVVDTGLTAAVPVGLAVPVGASVYGAVASTVY